MCARANRANNFFWLGRCKDELNVCWRLFDDFQEGVEAILGDHVGLVKNENLEAIAHRGKGRSFTQFASIFDFVVAGRINLNDIERTGTIAR